MEEKRTEIKEVGEFGLIERIAGSFTNKNASTILGVGDDAAVIDGGSRYMLVSSDMLIENIHFDLSYAPLKHLGYKAVSVNVSDIAAMNGIPTQITVNMGLSNRFSVEAVEQIYEGIRFACEDFNVDMVGGDTTSSPSGLVISVTVIGEVDKELLVKRSDVEKGDIVCVTGDLGAAFIGLQVLNREKQEFLANPNMQPKLDQYKQVVERQLKPVARMDIIHELRDMKIKPKAMIDISDGLASELHHLARQSEVGFHIFEDKLPIDKQTYDTSVEFNIGPVTSVMNGGEDYELLFAISQDDHEKLKNHRDIHFIGYATMKEEDLTLVTKSGTTATIKAQGWEHFKRQK